jgi:dTDP-4-amino-4,6-dideoxygalactose transaminase
MFPAVSRRIIHTYRGELRDIISLLCARRFIRGECVAEFEGRFAGYAGARYAVAVSSGRHALFGMIKALGLPSGSEVILPAYEDMSVPRAVLEAGLTPVFVDIDGRTQNSDISRILEKVTEKTSAVIVTHLFGNPADVPGIRRALGQKRVMLIEDCAHAVGTQWAGRHVGVNGDLSFFSFNTTKPFTCFGGGMILTQREEVWRALREYFDGLPLPSTREILGKILPAYLLFLLTSRWSFTCTVYPLLRLLTLCQADVLKVYAACFKRSRTHGKGYTRFSNVQAFVGLRQLERLEGTLKARLRNALLLDSLLRKDIPRPVLTAGCNYYFYLLFSPDQKRFRQRLLREGLDTGESLMRNCAALLSAPGMYPETERAIRESVQIPVHERLSEKDIRDMAVIINTQYTR